MSGRAADPGEASDGEGTTGGTGGILPDAGGVGRWLIVLLTALVVLGGAFVLLRRPVDTEARTAMVESLTRLRADQAAFRRATGVYADDLERLDDYRPVFPATVELVEARDAGWAARAAHPTSPYECAISVGAAGGVGPVTMRRVVQCGPASGRAAAGAASGEAGAGPSPRDNAGPEEAGSPVAAGGAASGKRTGTGRAAAGRSSDDTGEARLRTLIVDPDRRDGLERRVVQGCIRSWEDDGFLVKNFGKMVCGAVVEGSRWDGTGGYRAEATLEIRSGRNPAGLGFGRFGGADPHYWFCGTDARGGMWFLVRTSEGWAFQGEGQRTLGSEPDARRATIEADESGAVSCLVDGTRLGRVTLRAGPGGEPPLRGMETAVLGFRNIRTDRSPVIARYGSVRIEQTPGR